MEEPHELHMYSRVFDHGDLFYPDHSPVSSPLFRRMCLDDGNPSVASTALHALEAFLTPLARLREDEEDSMQGLSWMDYMVRLNGAWRSRAIRIVS